MKITHEDQHELAVLTLKGEFVGDAADTFRRAALERIDARIRDFVIDATQVESVDSQGLEVLLWLQEQCAERLGQVRLAGCPENLLQVLKITRLNTRLECADGVDQAIQSLGVTHA